jgi:hypothetical protein
MRARITAVSATLLAIALGQAAVSAQGAALHVRSGLYGQNASETTRDGYSNGGVNIVVAKNGKTITLAGVACYTGTTPSGGLPANDELTIRVPHHLTISRSGSFAFSGAVTLSPEESQTEESFQTTFTIKGHFQSGRIAVVGSDSSPDCQPATLTHFRLHRAAA